LSLGTAVFSEEAVTGLFSRVALAQRQLSFSVALSSLVVSAKVAVNDISTTPRAHKATKLGFSPHLNVFHIKRLSLYILQHAQALCDFLSLNIIISPETLQWFFLSRAE
jgi:hypothetical protein